MGLARFVIRRALRSRFVFRTNLPTTRIGRRSWLDNLEDISDIYQLTPKFDENLWESGYTEVIEAMVQFAGNPGQETLLTEYFPDPAKAYCRNAEKDYDPDAFIQYVKSDLGDTYYYAINEIIEQCALILQEVWDEAKQTFAEGLFGQSFGTDFSTPNRMFGSDRSALNSYWASAYKNGYKSNDTVANRKYNSEKNRQKLIERFGSGPTKPFSGSKSGMENVAGYAEYQKAAARNGKIIRP